ncbi:cation-translocating P-type ATPase [Blastopirellula sp. JC732]|uniref:P-type Zn(2+) transporter n=1 Tax=Blastopirellula sediminis TaxID=2894196 RepID=A0A9X1SHP2_9BACT|nr:cation-translocating P-type ATPase [Blastopirellula sediminis]MCC9606043.1 cation-translocating P-type ATPase [Blastopirellula sediminis]MCC9630658.1 cation-translocating P-type ATPase [Blastopirellula sediminis]
MSTQPLTDIALKRVSLHVPEMDCAEEVRQLRVGLEPVAGIEQLDFDVINGRMDVAYDDSRLSYDQLVDAVVNLGMTAKPFRDGGQSGAQQANLTRGKEIATGVSAALIAAGFLTHVVSAGSLHAALSAELFPKSGVVPMMNYLVAAFYLFGMISGAWYVAPKALTSARHFRADMNVLMCVAILGACLLGDFFEAAMVAFLFSLSLLLEQWSVARARRSIADLMTQTPPIAHVRCCSDDWKDKPLAEIQVGQICLVKPGERAPLDGVITQGAPAINQAPVTGESVPVEKNVGDEIYAGTINGGSSFQFEVTHAAGDTMLDRIAKMIDDAHKQRAPSQQWVEKFSAYYTPAMMILSAVIMVVPPLFLYMTGQISDEGIQHDVSLWFYNGLILLVIACPCALVIATPVSIVCGLTAAARNGVLVKGGLALETFGRVNVLAMDKTGTITTGVPAVTQVSPQNGYSEEEVLRIAASLEQQSNHPLATAIVKAAAERGLTLAQPGDFQEIPGRGASGEIDGSPAWVGSLSMAKERLSDPQQLQTAAQQVGIGSLVVVGRGEQLLGLIVLGDQIRAGAADVVRQLHHLGVSNVAVLSGDNNTAVQQVAAEVGIDNWRGEQLPQDKIAAVKELRGDNVIAMIGDGVNDGPALAAADVGVAMGAIGADAAIETADVALMSDEITKLPWLVGLARRTLRMIQFNIAFALGVKAIFVILAVLGMTNLWLAIIADTGVSLLVIANSLRLLNSNQH